MSAVHRSDFDMLSSSHAAFVKTVVTSGAVFPRVLASINGVQCSKLFQLDCLPISFFGKEAAWL